MEYDQAFRQWAAAMDEFHGRSELPDSKDLARSQELSLCVEATAVLYREARNRFANVLLERRAKSGSGQPQLGAAMAAFASGSNAAGGERNAASDGPSHGYREPVMALAARYCRAE